MKIKCERDICRMAQRIKMLPEYSDAPANKEKEEACKTKLIPKLGKERKVIFENGLKDKLSIADKETDELSFWDLIVAGKKFSCSEKEQDKTEKYLSKLTERGGHSHLLIFQRVTEFTAKKYRTNWTN